MAKVHLEQGLFSLRKWKNTVEFSQPQEEAL